MLVLTQSGMIVKKSQQRLAILPFKFCPTKVSLASAPLNILLPLRTRRPVYDYRTSVLRYPQSSPAASFTASTFPPLWIIEFTTERLGDALDSYLSNDEF